MASIKLCTQFASDRPEWESLDSAGKAARVILYDCLDRRGIKNEFSNCDADVIDEILDTWAEIICSTK